MAANAQAPVALQTLQGVRVFAAGKARGEDWTEQDIDKIVRNWKLYADLLKPPAVIGHEESQPLAEGLPATGTTNTGEPCFGVAANVRKEYQDVRGKKVPTLVADFEDVPGWFASLIRGKAYRTVSAELYPEPPEGFDKADGPMLRRVSFLGGELPQIKTLGDLPLPEYRQYAERAAVAGETTFDRVERRGGMILTFSEVRPMSSRAKRKKRMAELTAKSQATLAKFAEGDLPPADGAPPAGVSKDDMLAVLADAGFDVAVLGTADESVLAEIVRVWQAQQAGNAPVPEAPPEVEMADPAPTIHAPAAPAQAAPTIPAASQHPAAITIKYGEKSLNLDEYIAAKLAEATTDTAKTIAEFKTNARRENFETFCESQVKAGRLAPALMYDHDANGTRTPGPLLRLGVGLDDGVKRFGEKGDQTALDDLKELVRRMPKIPFSEQFASPAGAENAELGKVKRFAEARLDAKSAAKFVDGFNKVIQAKPEVTAVEYGVPPEFAV
jgi:hypothetical protein